MRACRNDEPEQGALCRAELLNALVRLAALNEDDLVSHLRNVMQNFVKPVSNNTLLRTHRRIIQNSGRTNDLLYANR